MAPYSSHGVIHESGADVRSQIDLKKMYLQALKAKIKA